MGSAGVPLPVRRRATDVPPGSDRRLDPPSLAGLAGALYAGLIGNASGAPFDFTRSITLLAYTVIVGVGSVPGAVLGGFIVTFSTLSFGASDQVAEGGTASVVTLITGVLLIAVVAVRDSGVVGRLLAGRSQPPDDPVLPGLRAERQEVGV